MRRSLRWTLVGWYSLLLATVIVVFGAVLYGRVSGAVLTRADATLESTGRAIAGALEYGDEGWDLDLSPDYVAQIGREGWLEITDVDGSPLLGAGEIPPRLPGDRTGIRGRSEGREITLSGTHDARIRVGRSIAVERSAMRALLALTIVAGVALLAFALAGGWWLATRALRPIDAMSRTARNLSERDLSGRIEPERVPVELRELACTLNGTFDRLQQAFARQARFTADASHELRTPLAVIRAQAELALRRERGDGEYKQALATCLRSSERMSGIVTGLLALARADGGEHSIARQDVALDAVAREAAEDARPESRAQHVALQLDLAPARVRGDTALLAEVVTNLVNNAIRYNRPGGHVDVRVRAENGSAVLQVADDGLGIPSESLPHVFERFYRVDPARSHERGGSGLGLAITRWIVEAHGGAIEVESRENEGSTFTVRLPAASDAVAPSNTSGRPKAAI